jgi:hypothetical protein
MRVKTMGSTGLYLTPQETAEVLSVSVEMVHVYDRRQLLEAYYPDGRKAGKRFLAEDVYALAELRQDQKGDFLRKLPQLAMRAVVTSRRVEKRLEELMQFLGLNDVALSLEPRDVALLHFQVERALEMPKIEGDHELLDWAKKLLAINEEYLELVKMHLGDDYPWKPYLDLARKLSERASGRHRSFIEHARANLRNVAYFYERSFRGPKAAERTFPGERYSGRLLRRVLPNS